MRSLNGRGARCDAAALDGGPLRGRLHVLSRRTVPGLRQAGRRPCRRAGLLHRLDLLHRRRRGATVAGLAAPDLGSARQGGLARGGDPVGRNSVLQRHDVHGHQHVDGQRPVQPARLASRRARVDLLSDLGRDCLLLLAAARLAAGTRGVGVVGARPQPARLHLLRDQRRGRLRRSLERVGAGPRGGKLEHLSRRSVLPDQRPGHADHRPHGQGRSVSAPAQDRDRERRPSA